MNISNYLNKHLNLELDTKEIPVIGMTGTVGKTSTIEFLRQYLENLGKKVLVFSSVSVGESRSISSGAFLVPEGENGVTLSSILLEAYNGNYDLVIIECHHISILNGCFDDVDFDIKIIGRTFYGQAVFCEKEKYFVTKGRFVTTTSGKAIINIHSTCKNSRYIDGCGSPYSVLDTALSVNYDDVWQNFRKDRNLPFPNYYIKSAYPGVLRSLAILSIDNEDVKVDINIPLGGHAIQNLLVVAATLKELNLFSKEKFENSMSVFNSPYQRFEIFRPTDNKIIIMDLGEHTTGFIHQLKTEFWNEEIPNIIKENFPDYNDNTGRSFITKFKTATYLSASQTETDNILNSRNSDFDATYVDIDYVLDNYVFMLRGSDYNYTSIINTRNIDIVSIINRCSEKINKTGIPFDIRSDREESVKKAFSELEDFECLVISGLRGSSETDNDIESIQEKKVIENELLKLQLEDDYYVTE